MFRALKKSLPSVREEIQRDKFTGNETSRTKNEMAICMMGFVQATDEEVVGEKITEQKRELQN